MYDDDERWDCAWDFEDQYDDQGSYISVYATNAAKAQEGDK